MMLQGLRYGGQVTMCVSSVILTVLEQRVGISLTYSNFIVCLNLRPESETNSNFKFRIRSN